MTTYQEFLASKIQDSQPVGFDVPIDKLNPALFDWQKCVVQWALRRGRAALFEDCGLGKTFQQLEWAHHVSLKAGPVLILTPLAVAQQTLAEAIKFDMHDARVVHTQAECGPGINITNYEKLHHFEPGAFAGVVLDESSILKNFMGKTKRQLVESFANTPYRLCCTATPAPNDYMEIGNHSDFLGVLPSDRMLSRWFLNDTMKAGGYRLKGHAATEFWKWVASWAVSIATPSDIGFADDGYILPPVTIHDCCVFVDHIDGAGDMLFRVGNLNATSMHGEMKRTCADRCAKVAELVSASDETWVVWCNTNYEADELARLMPFALEVRGNEPEAAKERKLMAFTNGQERVIITKPSIAGFGLNWQHCHNAAFVGLSYSFEQYYQAMRRTWRFGQQKPVNVHVIYADTEGAVINAVRQKQEQFYTMRTSMVEAMRDMQTNNFKAEYMQVEAQTKRGRDWTLHCGDSCEVMLNLPDCAVGLSVFSPPFANLYIYSDSPRDLGNCEDEEEFFKHFEFIVRELYRITIPGRLAVIHCKDLPKYRGRDGEVGLKDFPGHCIRLFEDCGWTYHSRVTIWKCPVTERERTNNNGLLHKTVMRDSSQIRQGMADFVLAFRKPPSGDENLSALPIERPQGLNRWVGDPELDPRETDAHPSKYARHGKAGAPSVELWRRYAEPVWWDIDQTDVLNFHIARESQDEKHICPLQLGLIRRCIYLWSLPGDLVFSPFAGVGSEGVVAIEEERKFEGIELKPAYFRHAVRNLEHAEAHRPVGLFEAE